MRGFGVAGGLAWLGMAALAPAAAAEFDPNEIRIITPTTATSTCIGDPRTPICAVETFEVCLARRDLRLCEMVGQTDIPEIMLPEPGTTISLAYKIVSYRILRPRDIPPELKHTYWARPGYADLRIFFWNLHDEIKTEDTAFKVYYSVKPSARGWQIVDWSADTGSGGED